MEVKYGTDGRVVRSFSELTRAPYGRGPDTIVADSVRKVWQLPADQVRIGGRSWPDHLAGILSQVTAGLGCQGMHVSAAAGPLQVRWLDIASSAWREPQAAAKAARLELRTPAQGQWAVLILLQE